MRKLLTLQRRIFRALQDDAETLLGETPEEIRKYEREFENDFKGVSRLKACSKAELVREIQGHDVTLIADFHTFSQAQRTALRLIRDAAAGAGTWCLGLELIPSQFQAELDAFQRGEIGLEEFHAKIQYDREWGFEWSNYAPLFEWARQNGARLVALNRPRELLGALPKRRPGMGDDLHERDQWAAGIITDLFHGAAQRREKLKMMVVYGELHVASAHLPEQIRAISAPILKSPLRTLVVHQNHDSLYWRLARQGREHQTDVLKLKRNIYCVISSPPWAKLQSLVSWAETGGPEEQPEDDYLSMMKSFGQSISELIEIPPPDFDALTIKTIDEADFIDDLEETGKFSAPELGFLRAHVMANRRILIPRVNIAYLGTPSTNGAAELAAAYLQRQRTRSLALFERETDDFFRLVIEAAFAFFGSLVLNPRRKCDLPADHERRIELLEHGTGLKGPLRQELQARKLALAVHESRRKHPKELKRAMSSFRKAPVALLGAEFLGQMLGKKLQTALAEGKLGAEVVRYLCLARSDGEHRPFEERYLELCAAVAGSRVAPSKSDVL